MSRSVRFREFGASEILKIEDVVVPNPGPKEIRLRTKAFGLERIHALQSRRCCSRIAAYAQCIGMFFG
jgi:NADPH:quinone reductase-like Zn-dependent oxidoreductase